MGSLNRTGESSHARQTPIDVLKKSSLCLVRITALLAFLEDLHHLFVNVESSHNLPLVWTGLLSRIVLKETMF
ncbi:hypothetical protein DPMN_041613 [Dreissena polymorpha]|uniref:Uncharacterized protein n=1 Tax=Dreissena polymorpha TaxID=45954 RepID=A0A9D4CXJ6_DREPO|nr:hypothetical protein DPMN_041613 [Dreissena polymorpha]